MIDNSKYYIFYDADCMFCANWVQWLVRKDVKDQFRFAALSGDFGKNFLNERNLQNRNWDSVILWKPSESYVIKMKAVVHILKLLGGKYHFLAFFTNVFSANFGDFIYDKIAKKRLQINAKHCPIPTPEFKNKWVD